LKSAKFVAIGSKGDVQKNTIPSFFFRLRKNLKPLDSFRQDASLEPKKLYLAQFREIAKIKKKNLIFAHDSCDSGLFSPPSQWTRSDGIIVNRGE
jgi:hypothetical protein